MRRIVLVVAIGCGGCGLLLGPGDDLDLPARDGGADDGSQLADTSIAADVLAFDGGSGDDAASDASADASACSGTVHELPLDLIGATGAFPWAYTTDCYAVAFGAMGDFAATPVVAGATNPPHGPVIIMIAEPGLSATLVVDFGRTVRDLSFVFEWLSLNSGSGFDERLTVDVDGVTIVPTLGWGRNVLVAGEEIRSTDPKGDGRVDIAAARMVAIRLRNALPTNGQGIELHSFTFTVDGG